MPGWKSGIITAIMLAIILLLAMPATTLENTQRTSSEGVNTTTLQANPDMPPTQTPPGKKFEVVRTKNLHLSRGVTELTVLKLPRQHIILKEISCLIQNSKVWETDKSATMSVTVGRITIECNGTNPTSTSQSPMTSVPSGANVTVTINDGGIYEIDLVLLLSNKPISVSGPPIITGNSRPTDPDNDGDYEDLNGNGRTDFDDIVTYFQHIHDSAITDHVTVYDFNKNNRIDFDDLVTLFKEI